MGQDKNRFNPAILPILFGFFVMGFVDVVGIATNYVKGDFGLSDTMANLIPMMVFLWFALFSIPSGILMRRVGRRHTVALALLVTAVAMALPLLRYDFVSILLAFALLGIGNTVLQVSLNPMVAAVVSPERTTSVLTLGQFLKAVSSFLGPLIAVAAASYLGNWKGIFAIYALITLVSLFWLISTVREEVTDGGETTSFGAIASLLKDKYILALFGGILFVVGIDVGLNTTIPKLLMDKCQIALEEAGLGTSLYFSAKTIGTFLGAFLLARLSAQKFFFHSMWIAIVAFVVLLASNNLAVMLTMIVIVGLTCANVFSILFSYALQHRAELDNEISALMIMGVSGGALITPLMGLLADQFGQVAGMSLLLVGILYLLACSKLFIKNK